MAYTPQINYPAYNPYQTMQMPYQMPQQQPQMQMPQAQPQAGYSTRPVTSREEALGAQVDFFGPGTLMPDLAHGVIYLKRFNANTGASDLFEFRAAEQQTQEPLRNSEELGGIREQLSRLEAEIEKLKSNRTKVVKKNDDE